MRLGRNGLKRLTLGLRNEEVRVHEGTGAETAPDEEDGRSQIALVCSNHVRSDDGNDGVPEPVGGSGETNTTGSDGEREDLANDDPCTGAPCGCEEEDEDTDEGDLGVDSVDVVGNVRDRDATWLRVCVVEADCNTNDGDEELTDQHTQSTPDQERSTTKLLNGVEGDGGRADVDQSEDQGDQERVADGAGGLQEGGRVVEDEIHASPLLHHLQRSTEDGAAQVGFGMGKAALKAVHPAVEPAT